MESRIDKGVGTFIKCCQGKKGFLAQGYWLGRVLENLQFPPFLFSLCFQSLRTRVLDSSPEAERERERIPKERRALPFVEVPEEIQGLR